MHIVSRILDGVSVLQKENATREKVWKQNTKGMV
jgi:hypothetical protein